MALKIRVHENNYPDTKKYLAELGAALSELMKEEDIYVTPSYIYIRKGRLPTELPDGINYKVRVDVPYATKAKLRGGLGKWTSYSEEYSLLDSPQKTARAIAAKINKMLPAVWSHYNDNYDMAVRNKFPGLYSHYYDKYLDVIDGYKKEYTEPAKIRAAIDKLIDNDED